MHSVHPKSKVRHLKMLILFRCGIQCDSIEITGLPSNKACLSCYDCFRHLSRLMLIFVCTVMVICFCILNFDVILCDHFLTCGCVQFLLWNSTILFFTDRRNFLTRNALQY